MVAVEGEVVTVKVALAGILHHAEEGAVELVVVTVVGEEVVAGQRCVRLEPEQRLAINQEDQSVLSILVVTVKTWLVASQGWVGGCPRSGVAADRKLVGHWVPVTKCQTHDSQKPGKIVADVVKVLLHVNKL